MRSTKYESNSMDPYSVPKSFMDSDANQEFGKFS